MAGLGTGDRRSRCRGRDTPDAGRRLHQPCELLPLFGDGGRIEAVIVAIRTVFAAAIRSKVEPISSAKVFSAASIASTARSVPVFMGTAQDRCERERTRLSLLLLTPTPPKRFRASIWVGMAPTCTPGVVGTSVRNTVAPVPITRLVAPVGPVPTASTAIAYQLDRRCRTELDPRRLGPNWGRLCRCSQD